MHKILLAILLFAVFFFPKSEVFAQTSCSNLYECPAGDTPYFTGAGALRCRNTTQNFPNKVTRCTTGTADAKCQCKNPIAAAVSDECKKDPSKCTRGGGQRCLAGPGTPDSDGKGILTAIGCVPTEPKALVEGLLKYGTVAAGAIAFLLMLLGAIGMITAEGNPEAIKNSQERFYSAIVGLLLIIFSVLLMQVIGVDILDLPGFER